MNDSAWEQTWVLEGKHPGLPRLLLVSPRNDPERWVVPGPTRGGHREIRQTHGLVQLATHLTTRGYVFQPAQPIGMAELGNQAVEAYVGFHTLPSNYLEAVRLGEMCKEGGAKGVVLGGPYAGAMGMRVLECRPFVDHVVTGPGEETLWRLLIGETSDPLPPLTPLPLCQRQVPDHSLWPRAEGQICASTYWQDGCPVASSGKPCVFCTCFHTPAVNRRVVVQVVEEMKQLRDQGYTHLEDGGDDFASGGDETVAWLTDLADAMEHENLSFEWFIHASVSSLTTPHPGMLETLHRVGVRTIQPGFETGDPERMVRAKCTADQEEQLFEAVCRLGLKLYGTWVIGMPGETEESVERTIDQIRNLHSRDLLAGFLLDPLWPGPGSIAFRELCKREWIHMDYISPEVVMGEWFRLYTKIDFEWALEKRLEVVEDLWPAMTIKGSMLL